MITVLDNPTDIAWVINPIAYRVQSDAGGGTRIQVKVSVGDTTYFTNSFQLFTGEKPSDANGIAVFRLEKMLIKALNPFYLPISGSFAEDNSESVKECNIEISDDNFSTSISESFHLVLGGWGQIEWAAKTVEVPAPTIYFKPGLNGLLTTRPLSRDYSLNHPDFVSVLVYQSMNVGPSAFVVVDFTVHYTDGSTDATVSAEHSGGHRNIVHVPLGDSVHGFSALNPAKTIDRIEAAIRLEGRDLSDVVVGTAPQGTLTLNVKDYGEQARQFFYMNSLGGMESFIATGNRSEKLKTLNEHVFEKYQPWDYYLDGAQYSQGYPTTRLEVIQPSGYIEKKEDFLAYQDIYLRKQLWENINGALVPCILTQKDWELAQDKKHDHAFTLQFFHAFNYTG